MISYSGLSDDICSVYKSYNINEAIYSICTMCSGACIDVVHWIFSIKYWSLSIKIEMIKKREDPDKHNVFFYRLYIIGIIMNVLAGVFGELPLLIPWKKWVLWSSEAFIIPLVATCVLMILAYWRFSIIKSDDQSIKMSNAILNTLGFSTFVLCIIICNIVRICYQGDQTSIKFYRLLQITSIILEIAIFFSNLMMSIMLYRLV